MKIYQQYKRLWRWIGAWISLFESMTRIVTMNYVDPNWSMNWSCFVLERQIRERKQCNTESKKQQ